MQRLPSQYRTQYIIRIRGVHWETHTHPLVIVIIRKQQKKYANQIILLIKMLSAHHHLPEKDAKTMRKIPKPALIVKHKYPSINICISFGGDTNKKMDHAPHLLRYSFVIFFLLVFMFRFETHGTRKLCQLSSAPPSGQSERSTQQPNTSIYILWWYWCLFNFAIVLQIGQLMWFV